MCAWARAMWRFLYLVTGVVTSLTLDPYRQPLETLLSSIQTAESNLKIYIHPNPFPNPSCRQQLAREAYHFSFETVFPQYIRSSPYHTLNPDEADLFLIEHDIFCSLWSRHFTTPDNRLSSTEMIETYFKPFFQSSIFSSKYFLRNKGRDHLFLWLADNGPFCSIQQHAMSSLDSQFTRIIHNVIFLTYFASNGTSKYFHFPVNTNYYPRPHSNNNKHNDKSVSQNQNECFRLNHDIVIPQYHQTPCDRPLTFTRSYLSHFRGMIRPDKACSPGSRLVLRILGRTYGHTTKIAWNRKDIFLKDALVGFAPSGVACWSARIYESICSNTIPVIIARETVEPFERFFYWKNFTIKVDTEDIPPPPPAPPIASVSSLQKDFFQDLQDLFPRSGSGNYSVGNISRPYLESLNSVRQWFSWDKTSPHNAWRLLGLELFCRTKKANKMEICQQSSSLIANSTYMMGLPVYERAVSPDLPYVDRTNLYPNPPHPHSHSHLPHNNHHKNPNQR
jgi:hypothetical protein